MLQDGERRLCAANKTKPEATSIIDPPVNWKITSDHTSHVTRHTSHVTRHTSYVTRHTSHVTRHTSHVTRHTSHVTRHTSHVTRHTSHVTRHTSHVTHHTSHDTCSILPEPPFTACWSTRQRKNTKAAFAARACAMHESTAWAKPANDDVRCS
jgi:hypothetical protein